MNKIAAIIIFGISVLTIIGWSPNDDDRMNEAGRGNDYADRRRQGSDEDIKRAQGDNRGGMDIHERGPLLNDERGRW